MLKEGSYDTGNMHTGNSYNIPKKYAGMSVSIIADKPGSTFVTSGELGMEKSAASIGITFKFYRVIFTLPVYSDIGINGFSLNADIQTNEFYNCIFLPPTGGYNGEISNTSANFYNCLFANSAVGSCFGSNPLKGKAINCAGVGSQIDPAQGTKTTCLTNITYDTYTYMLTSGAWQNTGTGTNPNGTRANIGVYGGEYAW